MDIIHFVTDKAIIQELGNRLRQTRLDANISQADMAKQTGISLRTISRLEAGEDVAVSAYVKYLRALNLLDTLDAVIQEPAPRPSSFLAAAPSRKRASASHRSVRNNASGSVGSTGSSSGSNSNSGSGPDGASPNGGGFSSGGGSGSNSNSGSGSGGAGPNGGGFATGSGDSPSSGGDFDSGSGISPSSDGGFGSNSGDSTSFDGAGTPNLAHGENQFTCASNSPETSSTWVWGDEQ